MKEWFGVIVLGIGSVIGILVFFIFCLLISVAPYVAIAAGTVWVLRLMGVL